MNEFVLSGLVKRRAELAGDIENVIGPPISVKARPIAAAIV